MAVLMGAKPGNLLIKEVAIQGKSGMVVEHEVRPHREVVQRYFDCKGMNIRLNFERNVAASDYLHIEFDGKPLAESDLSKVKDIVGSGRIDDVNVADCAQTNTPTPMTRVFLWYTPRRETQRKRLVFLLSSQGILLRDW